MNHSYTVLYEDIKLRSLEEKDIEKVRNWRNLEWARTSFLNADIISQEQQLAWYQKYIKKENDLMFVIEWGGMDIGIVALYNIDYTKSIAEFGRLLIGEPLARGKGIGKKVVKAICNFGFNEIKIETIVLEVLESNSYATKIYLDAGFNCKDKYLTVGKTIYKMEIQKGAIDG
ncbi:GNAT family N-acetyltransferase [Paenibacillus oceani]|uniref:GNAT family N-acetyltransferase n=1 Tax=Paenibacillus oceani TaxID=2772510 RepID=A0A927CDQ9_9BACL|nr:GNAT family N-acetyltransferase [Paenibacillus oceani]MBD2864803.1 GNAT family N-acetyltransferase [Paenibacillus oceani]